LCRMTLLYPPSAPVPATREIKAHLDGLTRAGALVMLTPKGKAYQKRYFNEHWREDADKIGAGELNFHDNRGTAATLLAEAGATAPEIAEAMTWTVDKAQRIIDTYLARRGVLAANAIAKLEDHRDKQSLAYRRVKQQSAKERPANKIANRLQTGARLQTKRQNTSKNGRSERI
jgi:hypothetical protein